MKKMMIKYRLCSNTICISSIILMIFFSCHLQAEEVVWDVTEMFGVDTVDASPGTIQALESARAFFADHPNDTLILYYPDGEYNFMASAPSIDFGSSFSPGLNGRLVIQGAGYESTVFITKDRKEHSIYGKNVYGVLFKGIHFTRDYCTVSQGTVVSVAAGEVVLDLHEDFPTPDSLIAIGRQNDAGLWLRKYTDDVDDPHIITENNDQIAWDTSANTYQIEDRRWKIGLKNSSTVAPYSPGDIIGIKLKHGGQTYWLCGGDDIHFESCKWTRKTRGVIRCGISNVSFIDCHFDRGPKVGGRTPVMASPGGGPQIGQPNDDEIFNVLVENCTFISSGDDNVAFFNVTGGAIRNIVSKDAFARGILLYEAKTICLENNEVVRCPIRWEGGDGVSDCDTPITIPDTEPPSIVTGLVVTDTGINAVTLSWNPATDNVGVEEYEVYQANNYLQTTSDTFAIITGLNSGTLYAFRVLAVDSSGNKSQITGISVTTKEDTQSVINQACIGPNSNVRLFPNPADIFIKIHLADKPVNALLTITDLSGRTQFNHVISNNISVVNISQLKNGMYIAEIKLKNNSYRQQLLIK
jgi:hypothetical protein